jgi:fluoride exporter
MPISRRSRRGRGQGGAPSTLSDRLRYSLAMQAILLVFIGAGLGGVLRHFIALAALRTAGDAFPYGIMFINVTGSFVMGLVVGWLAFRAGEGWTRQAQLFVATGVLGGYTTFSTFSLDCFRLIERGQLGAAAFYSLGSLIIGVGGLWGGLALVRSLT